MNRQHSKASFAWGVPGLVLQIVGGMLVLETQVLGLVAAVIGTLLLVVGLGHYAKAKGHHPAWALAAMFSWLGLLLLALLPDRTTAA